METFIFTGIIILVVYQIYSTDKNVNKLVKEIDELKSKIDGLKK